MKLKEVKEPSKVRQTAGVNGTAGIQTQVGLILVLGSPPARLKDNMGENAREGPQVEQRATDKIPKAGRRAVWTQAMGEAISEKP